MFKLILILCFQLVIARNILDSRATGWATLSGEPTLINAHRGETVLVPENTLGSTELGAIENADHIELDIATTKDGVLVVFHDLTLKETTNVASLPQFADKMTNYTGPVEEEGGDSTMLNNWFIKDFTIAELQTLRVNQRAKGIRPTMYNGFFKIPTFNEFLDTVHHSSFNLQKPVGIVPELKSPYFYNLFQSPKYTEDLVLKTLSDYGYPIFEGQVERCFSQLDSNSTVPCGSLVIQSFDYKSMLYLHEKAPLVPKSMLVSGTAPHLTHQGLQQLSTWAAYVSPAKELLLSGKSILAEGEIPAEEIVSEAHKLGLKVFIWTVYDSHESLNKEEELYKYFAMGVDGMFAENIPETREIRSKFYYEVILE